MQCHNQIYPKRSNLHLLGFWSSLFCLMSRYYTYVEGSIRRCRPSAILNLLWHPPYCARFLNHFFFLLIFLQLFPCSHLRWSQATVIQTVYRAEEIKKKEFISFYLHLKNNMSKIIICNPLTSVWHVSAGILIIYPQLFVPSLYD